VTAGGAGMPTLLMLTATGAAALRLALVGDSLGAPTQPEGCSASGGGEGGGVAFVSLHAVTIAVPTLMSSTSLASSRQMFPIGVIK
jgi:hypothetical protein